MSAPTLRGAVELLANEVGRWLTVDKQGLHLSAPAWELMAQRVADARAALDVPEGATPTKSLRKLIEDWRSDDGREAFLVNCADDLEAALGVDADAVEILRRVVEELRKQSGEEWHLYSCAMPPAMRTALLDAERWCRLAAPPAPASEGERTAEREASVRLTGAKVVLDDLVVNLPVFLQSSSPARLLMKLRDARDSVDDTLGMLEGIAEGWNPLRQPAAPASDDGEGERRDAEATMDALADEMESDLGSGEPGDGEGARYVVRENPVPPPADPSPAWAPWQVLATDHPTETLVMCGCWWEGAARKIADALNAALNRRLAPPAAAPADGPPWAAEEAARIIEELLLLLEHRVPDLRSRAEAFVRSCRNVRPKPAAAPLELREALRRIYDDADRVYQVAEPDLAVPAARIMKAVTRLRAALAAPPPAPEAGAPEEPAHEERSDSDKDLVASEDAYKRRFVAWKWAESLKVFRQELATLGLAGDGCPLCSAPPEPEDPTHGTGLTLEQWEEKAARYGALLDRVLHEWKDELCMLSTGQQRDSLRRRIERRKEEYVAIIRYPVEDHPAPPEPEAGGTEEGA